MWPAGACFDAERRFRYALWLQWGPGATVVFILLNPSYADGHTLDNTARACRDFGVRLGFGGMEIVNAYPAIGSKPKEVLSDPMRDGEEDGAVNDRHVRAALQRASRVIVGFGAHLGEKRQAAALARVRAVFRDLDLLEPLPVPDAPVLDHRPYAFAVVKNGMPQHPLYVPRDTAPMAYSFPKGGAVAWRPNA